MKEGGQGWCNRVGGIRCRRAEGAGEAEKKMKKKNPGEAPMKARATVHQGTTPARIRRTRTARSHTYMYIFK